MKYREVYVYSDNLSKQKKSTIKRCLRVSVQVHLRDLLSYNMIGTSIKKAITYLRQDKVIGVPTETVYGLAANAYSPLAVEKIYTIKQRPYTKPLNIVIQKTADIYNITTSFPKIAQRLANTFWPGPLTLILPKTSSIPDIVTNKLPMVGIRVPSNKILRTLLQHTFPAPLVIPSANITGHLSPTTAQQVQDTLGNQVPYILDGGPSPIGLESTIIGHLNQSQPTIFRLGTISIPQIEKVIGSVQYQPQTPPITDNRLATAPHQIQTPLHLGNIPQLIANNSKKKIGVLSLNTPIDNIPPHRQISLSPKGDLKEATQKLYTALHQLDQMQLDMIIAPIFPNSGLGHAINERLLRIHRQTTRPVH